MISSSNIVILPFLGTFTVKNMHVGTQFVNWYHTGAHVELPRRPPTQADDGLRPQKQAKQKTTLRAAHGLGG
jgi:hypothetical protein